MMAKKKQALLLFSKPPVAGKVKTRLTKERGGFLRAEQAAEFYKRCILDISELAMSALVELEQEQASANTAYDFFVSAPSEGDIQLMRETFEAAGSWAKEITYLIDSGATFDDHFDNAFAQIFALGYESIVSLGGDIPTLPKSHITLAFAWLDYFQQQGTPGFVQAPCQECGTSLVGFSHNTDIDHQGVYYNLDGTAALDAYVGKINERGIPSAFLSPVSDVDEISDLAHAVSCIKAMEAASHYQQDVIVPRRVLTWINYLNLRVATPPNDNHDPRNEIDALS
jgi:glycosyltransferase A (GT-A) superfamily protein (DUF2064 family)